jgi:hypothetical protein
LHVGHEKDWRVADRYWGPLHVGQSSRHRGRHLAQLQSGHVEQRQNRMEPRAMLVRMRGAETTPGI